MGAFAPTRLAARAAGRQRGAAARSDRPGRAGGRARVARARPAGSAAARPRAVRRRGRREHIAEDPARLAPLPLLAPLVPDEIWAAGVTYERSRHARIEESESSADVYALVYDAERPELFLKDAGCRRTVGPGEAVAVRSESRWTVPEPELGLVLDADGSIMAVTGRQRPHGARHRGREPALPAAGQAVRRLLRARPAVLVPDDPAAPYAISVRIWNAEGALVNEDATSTAAMHRSFEELASWCVRENPVPAGSVLLTGTGVVPPDDVALAPATASRSRWRASACSPTRCAPPERPKRLAPRPLGVGQHRDRLDLDLHARHGQLLHAHERARRARVAEEGLAQRVDERAIVDVREVDVDLDDVLRRAACGREDGAEVLQHLGALGDGVVAADEVAVLVRWRDSPRRTAGRWPRRRRSSG